MTCWPRRREGPSRRRTSVGASDPAAVVPAISFERTVSGVTDDDPDVILGVDPGTAVTGYGVVEKDGGGGLSLLECGVVRTSSDESLPVRIREIFEELVGVVERFDPAITVVEDVFQGKNARSALTLGHARGAILLAAALRDVEIAEYTPREIKKAVAGTGKATKDQVGFMVKKQLRLRSAPSPADAADGVAAALCHCIVGDFERVQRAETR